MSLLMVRCNPSWFKSGGHTAAGIQVGWGCLRVGVRCWFIVRGWPIWRFWSALVIMDMPQSLAWWTPHVLRGLASSFVVNNLTTVSKWSWLWPYQHQPLVYCWSQICATLTVWAKTRVSNVDLTNTLCLSSLHSNRKWFRCNFILHPENRHGRDFLLKSCITRKQHTYLEICTKLTGKREAVINLAPSSCLSQRGMFKQHVRCRETLKGLAGCWSDSALQGPVTMQSYIGKLSGTKHWVMTNAMVETSGSDYCVA